MMADFSKIIKYFKECYIADNRETIIWDIFSAKNESLHFLKITDIGQCDHGYAIRIPLQKEEELRLKLDMYKREKSLTIGFLFITGEINVGTNLSEDSKKRVCTPIIIANGTLYNNNDGDFILIDPLSVQLNAAVISQFIEDTDKISELENLVFNENIDILCYKVTKWFQDKDESLEITISTSSASKKTISSAKNNTFFNGMAWFIVNRSSVTRGIIHDLEELICNHRASDVLSRLFRIGNGSKINPKPCNPSNVPGVLSHAQEKILHNAASKVLSMVIGPPGTGKSYTIASIALDRFMNYESILIVSQNEHAVDVVQRKLTLEMGISSNAIIRVGKGDYLKNIKNYFSDLLRGIGINERIKYYSLQLNSINQFLKQQDKDFEKSAIQAFNFGLLQHAVNEGKKIRILKKWRLKQYNKGFLDRPYLFDRIRKLHETQQQKEHLLTKQINSIFERSVKDVMENFRTDIVNFVSAIKARSSGRQEDLFQKTDYKTILKALPIWICSLDSLHKALPLKRELFDLVIIDEATQCDIASCIPALYRASRAVIVGDQKQLRHISFLPKSKQDAILREAGIKNANIELNYRDMSILDLTDQALTSQNDVVLLDEHFRSQPDIISFSNQKFYNGHLRVMTERPNTKITNPVSIKFCKGSRTKNINKTEADELLKTLNTIIDSQKNLPKEAKSSIGVISFFSEHTDFLQKQILKDFLMDVIEDHQLRIGTPYAFQGEERDIMLLSCGIDNESPAGALTYLNRHEVLNVAITRAREYQIIFLSRNIDLFPPNHILAEYLKSIHSKSEKTYKNEIRDRFVNEITLHLLQNNIEVIEGHTIAGIPLDIVAYKNDKYLAIDLIGFPGEYEEPLKLERYKIFNRTGLQIYPLSLSEWTFVREQSVKNILSQLTGAKTDEPVQLNTNEALLKKIKNLELSLISCGEEDCMDILHEVYELHSKLITIIDTKLYSESLTYKRFLNSFENIVYSIIHNLQRIIALKNALPYNSSFITENKEDGLLLLIKVQLEKISSLKEDCRKGIILLNKSALLWSTTTTRKEHTHNFEAAINELEQLNEQITKYTASH